MSDQMKKSFILSVKRLRYLFNNLKDFDFNTGPQIEARANIQAVSDDDMSNIAKWMAEGTQAIAEGKRFIQLIEQQEK
jgi:cytochrome c553